MDKRYFVGRTSVTLILAAIIASLSNTLLLAQATGGIIGTIVDETGAALPGADVVAHNTGTGADISTVTATDGTFRMPEVPIGVYSVTARLSGFQTLVRQNIEVLTGRTVDLRLALKVGEIADEIAVVAPTPTVQTSSAEVQETIDSRAMRDLPLNGRNPLQLVVLTPGADFTNAGQFNTPENGGFGPSPGISVNGLHATDNNYQIDGGSFNDTATNAAPQLPNPDALQEFTVKSSNYSAQYSRAGGVVQFSTRSGTNDLHGSLFEFHRNDALDATPFFADDKQKFLRNQWGGTVGGPLVKNRTFYFGSLEFTRRRGSPDIKRLTVPSVAARMGDLSARDTVVVDPLTGEPFSGNRIPPERIHAISAELLELYPVAPDGTDTVFQPLQTDRDEDQLLVRLDHRISDAHQINGRWFHGTVDAQRDTGSPTGILGRPSFDNDFLGIDYNYILSPSLTFTGSFSYSRTETTLSPETPVTLQEVGVEVPLASELTPREMRINPTGFSNLFSGGLLNFIPETYEWRAHLMWSRDDHLLQFGLDVQRKEQDSFDASQGSGQFWFNGDRTSSPDIPNSGDPLADLLLGLPSEFRQRGAAPQAFRENKFHPWIQDTWRIHPTVTLNLGLRYEPWLPATDNISPLGGFLPGAQSVELPDAPEGLVFAGAGISDLPDRSKVFKNDWNNWAPRIGFAWDPFANGKTVVRAGYGIFYRDPNFNLLRDNTQQLPFTAKLVTIFDPPSIEDPFAEMPEGSPFPFEPVPVGELEHFVFERPVTTGAVDPNATQSRVQSWNLTIERELVEGLALSIGYVGNRGINELLATEGNPAVFEPGATNANTNERRVLPGIADVRFVTPAFGKSWYDSLQVRAVRRDTTGRGPNIIANYVYGKAIDISSTGVIGTGSPRDPFNPFLDRGRANFDVTHRANISISYPLPSLNSRGGLAEKLLNHWQVNAIINAQTGTPFTVKAGSNRSLSGVNSDNADLVGDPNVEDPTIERYFNTEAFVLPAPGTTGTAGRNSFEGPGRWVVDFSAFKSVFISGVEAQLRVEAFNLFNHTNFSNPVSNLSNANFGEIQNAETPRVIQLGMKIIF
ncbi:MAG: hypothetical protein GEU99_10105 [Luteitalea sp.]|nr:hypothetical protein [Luteitalea sp.]